MTWVRPVLKAMRAHFGEDRHRVRMSLVLSPCVHATGQEAAIARTYPELDRVQAPDAFWPFLLWGKTAAKWDWHQRGAVLFSRRRPIFCGGHRSPLGIWDCDLCGMVGAMVALD